MLSDFTVVANAIAATTKKNEKERLLADYLRSLDDASLERAVVFFAGSPFPRREERVTGVGGALIGDAASAVTGRSADEIWASWSKHGDAGDTLESVKMTLFHPFAFMLAQPEEDPQEIVAALGVGAFADDKYDGIRAQLHSDGKEVRIYSRTMDNVTHRFPEIEAAARQLDRSVIFDGEIVAFSDRILPFAVIQTRLGRRKVSESLLREAPVAFFAFDLLFENGEALFELPLSERLRRLGNIIRGGAIRPSDQTPIRDAAHVDELFDAARARANEGLVIKDPGSIYTPGRRGKSWLKYKKALATLDCVVTAAEYGHGKRRGVLSDYTFAVRRDGELVNIGKAYSGLTDVEIDKLTETFEGTTTARYGPVHMVEPNVVLEIAVDRIQDSKRHKSGYALRFPRIARIRDDKTIEQISTIDEVRRIYEGQLKREKGA